MYLKAENVIFGKSSDGLKDQNGSFKSWKRRIIFLIERRLNVIFFSDIIEKHSGHTGLFMYMSVPL